MVECKGHGLRCWFSTTVSPFGFRTSVSSITKKKRDKNPYLKRLLCDLNEIIF